MQAIRYREGIDAATGQLLVGRDHLAQSLAKIWTTRPGERIMLLAFGTDLRSHLAEDVDAGLVLEIYNDLTQAVYDWEPEYRVVEMQVVQLTRMGALGLKHAGLYYPEGRFGNTDIVQAYGGTSALYRYEQAARRLH